MEKRFVPAICTFAILGILAFTTLQGSFRLATLIFLGGLALKTWIALLRHRQEQAESAAANQRGQDGLREGGNG